MDSFQEQSRHRRELEMIVVPANVAKEKRGQNYGLIIALFGISIGAVCILLGHDIAGTSIAGVDLVAIVTVFVIGKTTQRRDLEKKENIKPKR